MAITNKNVPGLHRKEWQTMNSMLAASAAGSFVTTDAKERDNYAMVVINATTQYIYSHEEDYMIQIPSGALAGTFGAGACGATIRWSATITANGGSTTTATTTAAITTYAVGKTVRFLTGLNAGREAVITGVIVNPAGTNTIQFAALPSVVANTDTFIIDTRRVLVMSAGTTAAGSFKSYDYLTGVWTTLSNTGLPATRGTDGKLVVTPSDDIFATGTATAGASTTITNAAKTWATNQWTNYAIRITSGTGIGQVRTIASNTGTVITVSAAWTVTPDATSVYEITGNDDFVYLLGNNAVTMYRYSVSGNSWTTMAPTTARAGAPSVGMSANWVGKTGDANWANESNIRDGKYIYSFRGGATSVLDRFDITGGTAGAGAWAAITYVNAFETFTTGSSYAMSGGELFMRKDATGRYFTYNVVGNIIEPFALNQYPDGAVVVGDKLWVYNVQDSGVDKVKFVYSLQNSGTVLQRIMVI
jgi:hypothetical protein